MDTIEIKFKRLNAIKTESTADYLKNAHLDDLQTRIREIDGLVKMIKDTWEATDPDDVPDHELAAWENKKLEAEDLAAEIKTPIEVRIKELGGSIEQQPVQDEKFLKTKETFEQIHAQQKKLTPEFIRTATKSNLKAIEGSVNLLQGQYFSQRLSVDKTKLSTADLILFETQRTTIAGIVSDVGAKVKSAVKNIEEKERTDLSSILISSQIGELNKIVGDIEANENNMTEAYLNTATRSDLSIIKIDTNALKGRFEAKSQEIDKSKLTAEQSANIETQQARINQVIANIEEKIKEANMKIDEKEQGSSSKNNLQQKLNEAEQKAKNEGERADAESRRANAEKKSKEDLQKQHNESLEREKQSAIKGLEQQNQNQLAHFNQALATIREEFGKQIRESQQTITNLEQKFSPNKHGKIRSAMESNESEASSDDEPVVGGVLEDARALQNQGDIIDPIANTVVQLKLGSIELPYFSGDLTEWPSFRDFFRYLVDDNVKLSDTIKFHQLRTHLKGAAFDTIKGYKLTGSNYDAAWKDLKRRYDRKDELIQEYIRKFIEMPAILTKANYNKIRVIVDTTNQMLRALPGLGAEVKNWDPFLVLMITTKLDEETRNDWKQSTRTKEVAKIKELIGFLEERAIELQPTQGDKLSQMLKGDMHRRGQRKIFQINEKKTECPLCKGPHKIWNCDRLKTECAKVKTEIIKSLRLCFKCLLKHQLGMCDAEDCSYCGGPHNILLCYKKENDYRQRIQQTGAKPKWQAAPPQSETQPKAKPPQPKASTSKANDGDWN